MMLIWLTGAVAIILVVAFGLYFYWLYATISPTDSGGTRRLVLISGCDSGFGHLLTRRLDALGYRVLAGCFTADAVTTLRSSCSDRVTPFQLDITSAASISGAVDLVRTHGGRLHALVNNAGIAEGTFVDFSSVETYRRVMDVNYFGHVAMTKAFIPFLLPAPTSSSVGGRVINMTSAAGLMSGPRMTAYSASKYALEAFSDGLRREMGPLTPWKLLVSIIEPSFMRTPMVTNSMTQPELQQWKSFDQTVINRWGQTLITELQEIKGAALAIEDPDVVVSAYIHAITAVTSFNRYHPGVGALVVWLVSMLPSYFVDFIVTLAQPRTPPTYFSSAKKK